MLISEDYYKKDLSVELTQQDIDNIIHSLNGTPYDIFVFLGYDSLIKKLEKNKEEK